MELSIDVIMCLTT